MESAGRIFGHFLTKCKLGPNSSAERIVELNIRNVQEHEEASNEAALEAVDIQFREEGNSSYLLLCSVSTFKNIFAYCLFSSWGRLALTCHKLREISLQNCKSFLAEEACFSTPSPELDARKCCFLQLREFSLLAQGGSIVVGGPGFLSNVYEQESSSHHGMSKQFGSLAAVIYQNWEVHLFNGEDLNGRACAGPNGCVTTFNFFSGRLSTRTFQRPLPTTDNVLTPINTIFRHLHAVSIASFQGECYMTGGKWNFFHHTAGMCPIRSVLNNRVYSLQIDTTDPEKVIWKKTHTTLIKSRCGHVSLEFEGKLWVVGGWQEATAERYDPCTQNFESVSQLAGRSPPQEMLGLMVILGELFVAFTCWDNSNDVLLVVIQKYEKSFNVWEHQTSCSISKAKPCSAVCIGTKIYVVRTGGCTWKAYDTVTRDWCLGSGDSMDPFCYVTSLCDIPKEPFHSAVQVPSFPNSSKLARYLEPENIPVAFSF